MNWREQVKDEELYVNKQWFEQRKREVPSSVKGLKDYQLLIKLAGIKRLAEERGYNLVDFKVTHPFPDYVVAKCKIEWTCEEIGNCNSRGPILYSEYANATKENTSSFAQKFLETIACNRAFVRCVRNYLGIHIVGADEMDSSEPESAVENQSSPKEKLQDKLESVAQAKGMNSFEGLKAYLLEGEKNELLREKIKGWCKYTDIGMKDCRSIIKLLES